MSPVPAYDPRPVVPSVVHIGLGAFHRGHQAVYADDLLATGSRTGGISAVSLHSASITTALRHQGHLYHLVERDDSGDRVRLIASIRDTASASADGIQAVLANLTAPEVNVVTITVTEKGYCSIAATGELDVERAEIAHDIEHPTTPRSLPGVLVEALRRRRKAGTPPLTVCSCDNLQSNGPATLRVVADLARHRSNALADWIIDTIAFPSSMVDRMVPAPTDDARDAVQRIAGTRDHCAVAAEPYSSWVLEDSFPTGRPPWERVGVNLVPDVQPFQLAKVRMLNGAHSALAYLGLLADHSDIATAHNDPGIRRLIRAMLTEEVLPTLKPPPNTDLPSYAAATTARLDNHRLGYTTRKVAADGAAKLPARILGTLRDRLEAGGSIDRLALVVAAYAACTLGPRSRQFAIDDPTLDRLLGRRPDLEDSVPAVDRLLNLAGIFGRILPRRNPFGPRPSARPTPLARRTAFRAPERRTVDPDTRIAPSEQVQRRPDE